jgi:hypothetical protein
LNGNLILSKVGEGVFIVRGEKEPFEAKILRPAGAKSALPATEPDWPAHSPVKPDQHWTGRHTDRRHRICTGLAGEERVVPDCTPGRSGFTPDSNWDPHQNKILVGARWLYRTGRFHARHTGGHTGLAGFYAGHQPEPLPEQDSDKGPVAIPD